jgi:hypothetical protein
LGPALLLHDFVPKGLKESLVTSSVGATSRGNQRSELDSLLRSWFR